jgi:hypothetical protein
MRSAVAGLVVAALLLGGMAAARAAVPADRHAPILVAWEKPRGTVQGAVVTDAGKVLRRMHLPCAAPYERNRIGWTIMCADRSSGYRLVAIDLRSGAVRTLHRDAAQRELRAGPVWLADGAGVALSVLDWSQSNWESNDPSARRPARSTLETVDAVSGLRKTVFEEQPCADEDSCTGREYQAPRLGAFATSEPDIVLVRSEQRARQQFLLSLDTGETTKVAGEKIKGANGLERGYLAAPTRRLLLPTSPKGPVRVLDWSLEPVMSLPFGTGYAGWLWWSPDGRYVSNYQGEMYDLVRHKPMTRRVGEWAPDSKRHALLANGQVHVRTLGGALVRTVFKLPRGAHRASVSWMGAGSEPPRPAGR